MPTKCSGIVLVTRGRGVDTFFADRIPRTRTSTLKPVGVKKSVHVRVPAPELSTSSFHHFANALLQDEHKYLNTF